MRDLIRKSDVLEVYADLYDIFDDNKAIQEELHKVFDKINDIPTVEPNCSENPNNCETCKNWDIANDHCYFIQECHYEPKTEPHHNGEVTEMVEPQTDIEIARAIVHKAIDDTPIAEDAYPDLRQKMHDAVDAYEPQTERSER